MPSIQYELDDGSQETERFLSGSPTLVNLWASWCSPCLKEMAELTVARRQLLEQEVNVISLSVDRLNQPPASTSEIEMKLKDLNYPFDWGIIDEIQLRQLQELHDHFFFQKRTLPLPTSFLIDAEGLVVGRLASLIASNHTTLATPMKIPSIVSVDRIGCSSKLLRLSSQVW